MAHDLKSRLASFIVTDGKDFKLKSHSTGDEGWQRSKKETRKLLQTGIERLELLQEKLYAQDSRGLLLIFQAMDAAGKDGAIKHVMSGVNPQGSRCTRSRRPPPRSSTTTSCGAPRSRFPSAAASASSTAPTTKKS